MKVISLTQGKEALVDDGDYEEQNVFMWFAQFNPSSGVWYVCRRTQREVGQGILFLHREIMKPPADMDIDHRNHDGLDCQRHNMRIATGSQNSANRRMQQNNTTGFRGVHRMRNRFQAIVRCKGVYHYGGTFLTPEEAAHARDTLAQELFGEFASLNFPKEIPND